MTAGRGDILLLGGCHLIPHGPDGSGRTSVITVAPATEQGYCKLTGKVDHVEILKRGNSLFLCNIHPSVLIEAAEKLRPTTGTLVQESRKVAEGGIEGSTEGNLLVESRSNDGQGSTL